ncbi:hypothetical protein EJB05_41642, partial [Eragrostis curvula]
MEGGLQEFAKAVAAVVAANGEAPERPYRGVSRRGGKWGADIQDPSTQERVWLGTYDTREEAACAYDAASRTLRPHAKTHFPEPAGNEETRVAVVLAHVAGLKRKREEKMRQKQVLREMEEMEAAQAATAAAADAAVPPVGVSSSIRLFGQVLTPAPLDSSSPSAPDPAANASASPFPPVLAPAPLAFAFPNAMAPPPAFHVAPAFNAPAATTPRTREYVNQCLAYARTTTQAQFQALRHLRDVQASHDRALAIFQDSERLFAEVQAAARLGAGCSDPGTQHTEGAGSSGGEEPESTACDSSGS